MIRGSFFKDFFMQVLPFHPVTQKVRISTLCLDIGGIVLGFLGFYKQFLTFYTSLPVSHLPRRRRARNRIPRTHSSMHMASHTPVSPRRGAR